MHLLISTAVMLLTAPYVFACTYYKCAYVYLDNAVFYC